MSSRFLNDLYEMVLHDADEIILRWDNQHRRVEILNKFAFIQCLLPRYFPMHSFQTFMRQLNMYGFHRSNHENMPEIVYFQHLFFELGKPELLENIKRKYSLAHYHLLQESQNQALDQNTDSVENKLQRVLQKETYLDRQLSIMSQMYHALVEDAKALEASVAPHDQPKLDHIATECGYSRQGR